VQQPKSCMMMTTTFQKKSENSFYKALFPNRIV
jgi:hypothetical protein